jgi:hypothetical protein
MAKVFNGRGATEEYMSTHSLTFSTPEMTLRKFALWLGEQISIGGGESGPRLFAYIEEKGAKKDSDLTPEVDDSFKPSGAVTDMYKGVETFPTSQMTAPTLSPLDTESNDGKFCISCGNKLKAAAKFCGKCGSAQA